MRDTELLIPASNLEVLKVAVLYGADAVYIGGEMYGLRAKAKNFSMEDVEEGIRFAHEHNVKVYITANIVAHNEDLDGIREYFKELKKIGPDALIISDPGVFQIAGEICPEIDRHISTQANSTNYATYNFWHQLGASRVVSARELSLAEIKDIRSNIPDDLEIESFIHGAMCISHSGRCLLSNYFTGKNSNAGACTHPCRWKYSVMEETRPGEYMPVYENERGTYIFNSKDLCMIEYIDQVLDAGIDSLKIEGRMKTALYVATVARTYRKAIDDYMESPEKYKANMEYYKREISKCTYRQFTTGFYFQKTDENAQIYDSNTYVKEYTYIGIVQGYNEKGFVKLEQRNKFSVGETIEIMIPDGENLELTVRGIEDEKGMAMESAPHPKQEIYVDFGEKIPEGYLLRRKENN
ncbi:MAG: U32 family peptidase [Anaerostipes sp.]|nr:U32 family peptidase [Anaerostipes sp.]